jgi:hypothetical protein
MDMTHLSVEKEVLVDAIERVDWYHINENKDLVSGANSATTEPLFKAQDIFNAIDRLPYTEKFEADWEDGYGYRNGELVYKSIDCSICKNFIKIPEQEDRESLKRQFKFCPFCGSAIRRNNELPIITW